MHRANGRMTDERLQQRLRIVLMHTQPRLQRAQPAQGEKTVERRTGQAQRGLDVLRRALTNGATRDQAELLRFLEAEVAKTPAV